ncbi:K(+)-transporting ATPase subunit C [Umezakia ovalisporum]|jgi:K+-transporting ATPase ATPase C chain|uniref:K(+)-transporting ATPase subunit C n=1 Tax=Umezakia ovalisporum TaxID=75695 RepID=UPI0006EFCBD3|nr:K(+)-transporting ATPase subunit C [Umezakia ovalisporum]MBI1242473.1 K(+)-transporting ATPase subunit C [Nostoc sp. RI_552]MDH6085268.1 K(+)-transporting ATPase subunit C [Umezakia ovalisporum TAC611]MDH6088548.1 K(+)-transporting ATPase subunit C [Umezakia ovalisporum Ak1311]CEJ42770.1 Potassium-transporting ATPase C chain 2) (ATP phosphohydrolase [potassium-transporting] C chain) (Potassium-binding and translocating subunit C) (Potassium-translocating ATPase C chain) [Umezakia ovalisporum
MTFIEEFIKAIRMTFLLWLLTAIIYPLAILITGQALFPFQANGSIMVNVEAQPIGSTLIGQRFTSDRYFHSRPSSVKYSQGEQASPTGISGGSNLAPSNPALLDRIVKQTNKFREENIQPTADLIYTSGSGLDPHISLQAAREQLGRVASARGIQDDEILPLINRYTDGRFLWIFGEPGVNVLRLNYALDLQEINRQ